MTTELSQLPSDPNVLNSGGGTTNSSVPQNTIVEANSFQNTYDEKQGVPTAMDHKGMTGMVSQLEQLSKQGITQLQTPPTNTGHLATDPQQIPTMVPGQQIAQGQNPQAAMTQSLQPSMMMAPQQANQAVLANPPVVHDYIGDEMQRNEARDRENQLHAENQQDSTEFIIDQIKVPIFVASLFFLFQMPVVKQFFFSKMPKLFSTDANLTTNGMLFMSVLFGGVYYTGNRVVKALDL